MGKILFPRYFIFSPQPENNFEKYYFFEIFPRRNEKIIFEKIISSDLWENNLSSEFHKIGDEHFRTNMFEHGNAQEHSILILTDYDNSEELKNKVWYNLYLACPAWSEIGHVTYIKL